MKRIPFIFALLVMFPQLGIAQIETYEQFVRAQEMQIKSQRDDFSHYKDSVTADFNRYRDSVNSEFARYLANAWELFKSNTGAKPPAKPKPTKMPVAKPNANKPATSSVPVDKIIKPTKPAPLIIPGPKTKPKPNMGHNPMLTPEMKPQPRPTPHLQHTPDMPKPTQPSINAKPQAPQHTPSHPAQPSPKPTNQPTPQHAPQQMHGDMPTHAMAPRPKPGQMDMGTNSMPSATANYKKAPVPFLGLTFRVAVAPKMQNITLKGINEKNVADFWKKLTNSDYQTLVQQYTRIKQEQKFNDFTFFQYILKSAKTLYPKNLNQQIAYTVFILNQFGYKAKIGKSNDTLICLLPIAQEVYTTPFLNIDGKKYYIFDSDLKRKEKSFGPIYTYRNFMEGCNNTFDMNIYNPVRPGKNEQQVEIKNEIYGNTQLSINQNLIDFYKNYPLVEMSVYANAEIDPKIMRQLTDYLRPKLSGLDEVEAVNALLKFIHKSFKYQTDDEQFGYEKPMFCEETLFYPYSDCEDNSILFVHLVQKLLRLEAVLLDYPGHIATAVKFNQPVNGSYINVEGKKFVICDPTYFGSSVGMCMPKYAKTPVKVIALRKL